MEQIDTEDLDTAITLGDAVCRDLGLCCDKRGKVIYQIYRKLREMKSKTEITPESEAPEA
jgi:hypothetical protein